MFFWKGDGSAQTRCMGNRYLMTRHVRRMHDWLTEYSLNDIYRREIEGRIYPL
jgi:hypothetical protein